MRGLGWRQRHMLGFVRRNAQGDCSRLFHISRGGDDRRTALSLQRRGLLRVVNDAYECWVVALPA